MNRIHYHQIKRQKELARKNKQQVKQQRRLAGELTGSQPPERSTDTVPGAGKTDPGESA